MYWFHVLISAIFFALLYTCFISLRVMLSTSLEMKTLHPWTQQSTWRRFLQVSVLLTHCNDLCTYLWLHSGGCLCFWQNTSIVCADVNVYWQLAPCYAPVPFLPALGLNNTERKASLLWRRFARHCNSLFLLFKKTTPRMYSFVTAVAEGVCSFTSAQNWSLTLWAVWKNPVGLLHVNIFQGQ